MITLILIFAVVVSVGGLILWQDYQTFMRNPPILKLAIGVLLVIAVMFQPWATERIDAGAVGIRIDLFGNSRGVDGPGYQYETGWVIYNSYTEQVVEYPTSQQHIEYEDQQVITKGGFAATIKPSFNYSIQAANAGDMFVNLRKPLVEVEQGWLRNAIVGAVNDVVNKWAVDSIFNSREGFENDILAKTNERVGKWFTVSQLRTNIVPPPSIQQSIEAKTRSIQEEQVADNNRKVAEAQARTKVAKAKGDSAEKVISALADARVIQAAQKEITPMYIEYLKVTRWNGVNPSTVLGGQGTIVTVK